ncbi:MAG: S-layer homology domain-containing protein [Lachnospirales bacterium]
MRRLSSIMLAFIMLFSSIVYDYNYVQAEEGIVDETVIEEVAADETIEEVTTNETTETTTSEEAVVETNEAVSSNMQIPTTTSTQSAMVRSGEVLTFTQTGTLTTPLVNVSINTGTKKIVGITYERGYNQTATQKSKRLYGYEEMTGNVTFTLDNVIRYVSVMVELFDSLTGELSYVTGSYEITGQRVYNIGSGTFSAYPTTPLNDDTNADTLIADKVGSTGTTVEDNGPMIIVDDEVWIFNDNGVGKIFNMNDIAENFNTSTNINVTTTLDLKRGFNEHHTSALYDGRYVIMKDTNGRLLFVEAETRTVYLDGNVGSIVTNYSTTLASVYGRVTALAYDHNNLYILTNQGNIFQAVRSSDGKYTLNTTALGTVSAYNSTIGNDMTFDGTNLWVANNSVTLQKFNVNTKTASTVGLGTGNYVSRIIYDGSKYIYASGTEAYYNPGKEIMRIDKDTNTVTGVFTDMPGSGAQVEDISFDGRNLWAHTFDGSPYARYRWDTVTGKRVEVAASNWGQKDSFYEEDQNFSIGVYDGKYQWNWQYYYQNIIAIGRDIYLTFTLSDDVADGGAVYVDDKDTTSPEYVNITANAVDTTSDVVYAAWVYDETAAAAATRNSAFFANLENYAEDDLYDGDWTQYKEGMFYALSKDSLPTDGGKVTFAALPKLNGYYTVYMINEEDRPYVQTIYVNNYVDIARLYINFVDDLDASIVLQNMDESYAKGTSPIIKTDKYVEDLAAMGYVVTGDKQKTVSLSGDSQEVNFLVTKDRTKWTEVIVKPYYIDDLGVKQYITSDTIDGISDTEIYTGKTYLISDVYPGTGDATLGKYNRKTDVDAPHIEGFAFADLTKTPVKTDLLATNGGTKDSFGKTYVEFEYKLFGEFINVKGIEVDEAGQPTGNLIYTDQPTGNDTTSIVINADKTLENWDLKGLANYDADGVFTGVTAGTESVSAVFGETEEVVFAYTRKMSTVTVEYYDGSTLLGSDVFEVPLNTEFTAVGKSITDYKLVDPLSYLKSENITTATHTITFAYKQITETVIIEAVDATGNVLGRDSVDYTMGETVQVGTGDLEVLLAPRYVLDTDVVDNAAPKTITVADNTVVQYIFKEMKTTVTVNYVEQVNPSQTVATKVVYDVPYGETITENAISVVDYYANGTVNYSEVAKTPTKEYTFYYTKAAGDIIVMAKDVDSGAILEYHVVSGNQGAEYIYDPLNPPASEKFTGSWLNNYELQDTSSKTEYFSDALEEIVINYKMNTYTVTVNATDSDGNSLPFFDTTTSKTFTYNKNKTYSIYAPPVTGYVVKEGETSYINDLVGISADRTHTFIYEPINTEVVLAVKTVTEDGKTVVAAGTTTGNRGEEGTIKLSEFPGLLDSSKWELADGEASEKTITYGTDHEVKFKLKRKQVTLTVVHEGTTSGGAVVELERYSYDVDTMTSEKVASKVFANYGLADDQASYVIENIGTDNVIVTIKYKAIEGNVVVFARIKGTDTLLEQKKFNVTQGELNYTVLQTTIESFKTYIDPSYNYDPSSITTLAEVVSDESKNVIYLDFIPNMVTVTVKYVDESGMEVATEKTFDVQYGSYVGEYAANVPFYNIVDLDGDNLTNESFHEITSIKTDTTITFVYEEILIPAGVINLIAKGEDGTILDIVRLSDKVGKEQIFDANSYFAGGFTGYILEEGSAMQNGVYTNGGVNIYFIYNVVEHTITVACQEDETTIGIPFVPIESTPTYKVQEGSDITINAPHRAGYIAIEPTSITLSDVMADQTVTFKYKAIDDIVVVKGIEVDSLTKTPVYVNGKENVVYSTYVAGDNLSTATVTADETFANWTLVGLMNTGVAGTAKTKDVTFGTDNEVVFGYTRNKANVTVKYLELTSGGASVTTSETVTVPLNSDYTAIAKAIENWELVTPESFSKTVTVKGDTTIEFYYKRLEKNVTIRAELEDGTLLSQYTENYPIGSTQNISADGIADLLSPRYSLVSTSPVVGEVIDTDTEITFVFKENLSTITVKYQDSDGTALATEKTYVVPYGTYISESAISVNDYYFSSSNYSDTTSPTFTIDEALAGSYEIIFKYEIADNNYSVIARDDVTGEILYYATYEGSQGETVTISAAAEFGDEPFMEYYTLISDDLSSIELTNGNDEIEFRLQKIKYTVTIKGVDGDTLVNGDVNTGTPVGFYDGDDEKVFTYTKGDTYEIYAPPVNNYYLFDGTSSFIADQVGIKEDREFTFVYKKLELGTTINVKAISDDEKYVLGTKILNGNREDVIDVVYSNYTDVLFDSDEWELTSSSGVSTSVTFGVHDEVVFKVSRKMVDVTVNYVDTTNGNDILYTYTVTVPTMTSYTADVMAFLNYELAPDQVQAVTEGIGTTNHTITIKYIQATGNVIIEAIDAETDAILARNYTDATEGQKYTVAAAIKESFDTSLIGYEYDTTSVDYIDPVTSVATNNIIKLMYKKQMATITVKYIDQYGNPIAADKEYQVQYGRGVDEYAPNLPLFNLVEGQDSHISIPVVNGDEEIVFEYYLDNGSVINVVAITTDDKIIGLESKIGVIGTEEIINLEDVFPGGFVGYTLVDPNQVMQTATYVNGLATVYFLYQSIDLKVTIEAYDYDSLVLDAGEQPIVLEFQGSAERYAQGGDDIIINAPYITTISADSAAYKVIGYTINGGTFVEGGTVNINDIAESTVIKFYYDKTDIPSSILVKHVTLIGDQTIILKAESMKGAVGTFVDIYPLTKDEQAAFGVTINPTYNFVNTVRFMPESNEDIIIPYTKDMSLLQLRYNTEIYESSADVASGKVSKTLTEIEKRDMGAYNAPNLVNISKAYSQGSVQTIIAPFDDNYVINTNKNTVKMRDNITLVDPLETVDYYYRNITGNVLIRAVIEDEKGTIKIGSKTYTALAQTDDDAVTAKEYNNARNTLAKLTALIEDKYILDESVGDKGLISGKEVFTLQNGETYKDHTLTYVYTGNYRKVSVWFKDQNGNPIPKELLGIESNPIITNVINGDYFTHSALNVNNYNYLGNRVNKNQSANATRTLAAASTLSTSDGLDTSTTINIEVGEDFSVDFIYEVYDFTKPATVNIHVDGVVTSEYITITPGQTLYAPYVDGYRPSPKSILVPSTEPNGGYSFDFTYTKIEPQVVTKTNTVTEYDTKTVYQGKAVYVGDAEEFDHNAYINGFDDGTVKPDKALTRAEVVSMLYNLLYTEDMTVENSINFSDIQGDEWYADMVYIMAGNGYITGYEDGTFKAEKEITREEIAAIISRIYGKGKYQDVVSLPLDPNNWSTDFILDTYASGYYKDIDIKGIDWTATVSRAEAIVMINNALDRIPNSDILLENDVVIPNDLSADHWAYLHIIEAMTNHEGYYLGNFGDEVEVLVDEDFDYTSLLDNVEEN